MFYFKVYYINISSAFTEIRTRTTGLDFASANKESLLTSLIARLLSCTSMEKQANSPFYWTSAETCFLHRV